MRDWVEFWATGFYLGRSPKAPGTVGTLAGFPFVYGFYFLGPKAYLAGSVLFAMFAIWIAEQASRHRAQPDSRDIVIDEMAGLLFCFMGLSLDFPRIIAGFLVFRFFDALKPPPISYLDRRLKGGFGIVVDDLAAGLLTNLLLRLAADHMLI